jgi:fatty-acyl-CoA synthase
MGAREDSILCNPLPLFHIFGLTCGLVTMLVFGARIAILEAFDPLMVLAVIQKEKCTIMFGVNTMYIALLNHPMLNMFNLQTLRTGAMGGAACPPEVMKQVMERMHIPGLYSGYGLTESSPVVTNSAALDDPIEMRINSIGRALPGIEVTIRNPETNEELPVNTEGEICSRGYATMKGYYKMEEETKKVIDEDGWLHTGDLGHLLPNGFVQITGRIKDMIIRGGENIYPKEVEDFLYSMPGIKDAQVVGIPSKKYGEEVAAFVILKENVTLTEEDVIDYCRGKISNFKIPRYVFFVDAYPLTASGKIQKFKLRETGEQKLQKTGSVI